MKSMNESMSRTQDNREDGILLYDNIDDDEKYFPWKQHFT